jgi:hypothetical protein
MMKNVRLTTALAATAALLMTTNAFAQPGAPAPAEPPPPPSAGPGGSGYYAQPPMKGPRFHHRRGLSIGFGFGVGGMSADSGPIDCIDCDYEPAAVGFDFHIGGMINPRLALLFEVWGTGQQVTAAGDEVLVQTMVMAAIQYWVTPQLWIKGGIGASHLSLSVDDGYANDSVDIDDGGGVMGAIGYELLSGPRFAVDLQLRLGSASYDGINDQIQSGLVQIGFNWY